MEPFYSNPDLDDGFAATAGRVRPHRGLDFPKREGVPVPAWAAGIVVVSEYHSGLGWVVEIDSGSVFSGYCHLFRQGLPVGTVVGLGDVVGYVGNTGTESLGPHLHTTAGNRRGAVFGASMANLHDPWPIIQATTNRSARAEEEDEDMPDSMYAVVDGVQSWCWINWATGKVFACHTQAEANWVAGYMGPTKKNFSKDSDKGAERYKNLLAMLGILAPAVEIIGGALSETDLKRIREQVDAGVTGALSGLAQKAAV